MAIVDIVRSSYSFLVVAICLRSDLYRFMYLIRLAPRDFMSATSFPRRTSRSIEFSNFSRQSRNDFGNDDGEISLFFFFFFFLPPSKVADGKFVYFDDIRKLAAKRGPENHPAFYCVWAFRARYFSLPLRGRCTSFVRSAFRRNCRRSIRSGTKSARRQTKLLFVRVADGKRVNRRILAFVRNFFFDGRHKSRDATGRTAAVHAVIRFRTIQWLDGG